jgi:hypothetical protein
MAVLVKYTALHDNFSPVVFGKQLDKTLQFKWPRKRKKSKAEKSGDLRGHQMSRSCTLRHYKIRAELGYNVIKRLSVLCRYKRVLL